MARIDRELAAVLAGDVLLLVVLAAFVSTLFVPMGKSYSRNAPGQVQAPWPEPVEGTYAR